MASPVTIPDNIPILPLEDVTIGTQLTPEGSNGVVCGGELLKRQMFNLPVETRLSVAVKVGVGVVGGCLG